MTSSDVFEMISKEEMDAAKAAELAAKIDQVWVQRIQQVPVGAGFRITRPQDEDQRNLKRRINAAAEMAYKTLDWTPEQTNLPPNVQPTSYKVRVKSYNKAAEEAARQNGTGGSSQAPQTTVDTTGTTDTSNDGEAAGEAPESTTGRGRRG